MQQKSNTILNFVIIGFIILGTSCTRQVKEQSLKTEGAKYRFVIASDSSDFKDHIHRKLIARYQEKADIDLTGLDKLKDIKTNDYNVIVIMDTCMAYSPSGSVQSFINTAGERGKIILFISVNSAWKFSSRGVDAITSASVNENIDSVYKEISGKIDEIISVK